MRSQLLVEIDKALDAVYTAVEKTKQKISEKYLRDTLKGFNTKYPRLGQLKDDLMSVLYFMTIRVVGLFIVLPVCFFWATYEVSCTSLRKLFNKPKKA